MTQQEANFTVITKQKQLNNYVKEIQNEKIIFIDTEFHSETTYYAELCLIQVATEKSLVAIDPLLNGLDLSDFVELISDENKLKVFHAARQDLDIFYKLNGNAPIKNIFDTQIAALALGLGEQISYANLVKSVLNKNIDKSQQVANWLKRPLSKQQMKYAMFDVIYLKEIFYKLMKRIEKRKRFALIKDELKKLESPELFKPNMEALYRRIKTKDSSPLTLTILRKLVDFREEEAQRINRQRNAIFRDEFIGFCARLKPTNHEELESVRGVTKKILTKYNDKIIEIVQESVENPIKEITEKKLDSSPGIDSNLKSLAKFLLQLKAKEHSISLKLVSDDNDLKTFLTSPEAPSKLRESWRWDLFGQDLELLRQGKLSITTNGSKVILKKEDD